MQKNKQPTTKAEQQKENCRLTCQVCGRLLHEEEYCRQEDDNGGIRCRYCRAEDESCGCSD